MLRKYLDILTPPVNVIGVWILMLVISPVCSAVTQATLVGPELLRRQIMISTLSHSELRFFDQNRDLRSARLDDFVQIADLPGSLQPSGSEQRSLLQLVDGQRLVGTWAGSADSGQTLRWQHGHLGEVAIDIDRITGIDINVTKHRQNSSHADFLWLANGDQMQGYLVAVQDGALEWQGDGQNEQDEAMVLPVDRIKSVRLANTSTSETVDHLVWFADGSALRTHEISIVRDVVVLSPTLLAGPSSDPDAVPIRRISVPLNQIARIDLASASGHLVDLDGVAMDVVAGGRVFEVQTSPRREAGAIWLHAPVTVRFALPPGTTRFAATANLAYDDEPAAVRAWANFVLLVRSGGTIVAREQLSQEVPSIYFNVPIESSELSIELDPGANGPVMDRLWLRHAVLFVENRDPTR